jgi:HD-like signal output (HDOD) protein
MNTVSPLPDTSEMSRALWALDTVARRPEYFQAPEDMRFRISRLEKLPPLPEIAVRILALRSDPLCDAAKLARVIELDPPLAAQLIRWANSPLYARRSRTLGIKEAITLLGFEVVFSQALALCAIRPLQAPTEGLLGKRFFWRHTLAGSALIQKLVRQTPAETRPDLGAAHLIFLLHNIGHLLLAHLYRREFHYLLEVAAANPGTPLLPAERFALGVDHAQLGAWLMQSWKMPAPIVTTVQHHHNPHYRGEHERLVWLTCLTDRLLGQIGIGDATNVPLEGTALHDQLGLIPVMCEASLAQVAENLDEVEQAVAQLIG